MNALSAFFTGVAIGAFLTPTATIASTRLFVNGPDRPILSATALIACTRFIRLSLPGHFDRRRAGRRLLPSLSLGEWRAGLGLPGTSALPPLAGARRTIRQGPRRVATLQGWRRPSKDGGPSASLARFGRVLPVTPFRRVRAMSTIARIQVLGNP
jgi:hypothetical protein